MGCCCSRHHSEDQRMKKKNGPDDDAGANLGSGQSDTSKKSARSQNSKKSIGSGSPMSEEISAQQEEEPKTFSFPDKAAHESKPIYYIALWDYEAAGKAELTVKIGDRIQQLNDVGSGVGPEWVFGTIMGEDRCGTGYVPRAFVAMEGSLEAERWFFGQIPRREAENYLRDAPAGTFLIRSRDEESSRRRNTKRATAQYTISLKKEDNAIRHYQVWRLAPRFGDGYFLTKRKKFPSVSDLVEWYRRDHPDDSDVHYVLNEPPQKPVPRRIELSMEAQKHWREIPRSHISIVKEIGRGNFGVVFEGLWHPEQVGGVSQRVAVKVLKHGTSSAKAQFLQEAVTMKNLSHRRLVKMYGVTCSTEPYWLITEFVKDGSLRNYLIDRHKKSQPLQERTLVEICAQVAEGMRYLEERRVVHRDLAARNVLVEERGRTAPLLDVKIADFGLAKMLQQSQPALKAQKKYHDIPVKWTAPEALKEAIYSSASDVWSFGVLIHEVFTHGQEPYPKRHARPDNRTSLPASTRRSNACPLPENATLCHLPNCFCSVSGKEAPGGLKPEETPQFVVLTFDDAVNQKTLSPYQHLFDDDRFMNGDGCPLRATFFVSHEDTDYSDVQLLYLDGHELASNSITHQDLGGEKAERWISDIDGQRRVMSKLGYVDPTDIVGFRAPQLSLAHDAAYEMMLKAQFLYDNSMSANPGVDQSPYWPQTLDYNLPWECQNSQCPHHVFPGLWTIPLNQFFNGPSLSDPSSKLKDEAYIRGAMIRATLTDHETEDSFYRLLNQNFLRAYRTNKAPYILTLDGDLPYSISQNGTVKGLERFLAEVALKPDVWFVTLSQLLDWMRSPVPVNRLTNFAPFSCRDQFDHRQSKTPPMCEYPNRCLYRTRRLSKSRHSLITCAQCPNQYPWIDNLIWH